MDDGARRVFAGGRGIVTYELVLVTALGTDVIGLGAVGKRGNGVGLGMDRYMVPLIERVWMWMFVNMSTGLC